MKLIADNLRITIPHIQDALKKENPEPVRTLVLKCLEKKPWAIDINTEPLGKLPRQGMSFFIKAVESVTDLPLVIDTSNPEAMKAGVEIASNEIILNGFSLEPRKVSNILPLAKACNSKIVGFLLFPNSNVPKSESERLEVALELFEKAESAGVAKEQVIIDPIVPPLAWEDGIVQARTILKVIQRLPELLGFPVETMGGLSNLTTGAMDKNKKTLLELTYISMLAAAGLDYALIDILNDQTVKVARTAGILSKEQLFSWEMIPSEWLL
jgi:5-methyltetrahydrofolate corrinoid/iron sulfur protein methyltransferase